MRDAAGHRPYAHRCPLLAKATRIGVKPGVGIRLILLKNSSAALLGTVAGVLKPFPESRSSILGRSERSFFAAETR